MKKNLAMFILALVALSAITTALEMPKAEDVQVMVDEYNKNIDKVPKIILKLFGNERINVYIDNEAAYGFVTVNGKIVESNEGSVEKPTLNIRTTEWAIQKIANKEISLKEALKKGYVTFEGVGLFKKAKYGYVKRLVILFS